MDTSGKGLPSCPDSNTPVTKANAAKAAAAATCVINKLRRRRGLRALKDNAKLRGAANKHAADMVARSYFSHVSPGGNTMRARAGKSGYTKSATSWRLGENLAWGTGGLSTPARIVQAWLDSPEHRKNLYNRRYRDAGMGVVYGDPVAGENAANAGTYVHMFGTTG